jgi:hypothetical protein
MATNKTVTSGGVHTVGTGTITQIKITAQPATGRLSLHDAASPDQAGAHNEIWPRGAGSSITFNQGLVVHCTDPLNTGTISITTA